MIVLEVVHLEPGHFSVVAVGGVGRLDDVQGLAVGVVGLLQPVLGAAPQARRLGYEPGLVHGLI